MQTNKVYAVRLKGTQKYLPRSQRRDGRGGSWLEPIDFSNPDSWPPRYASNMLIRTYANRNAAANLLRSHCRGKFTAYRSYDEEESPIKVKGSERNIEDYEIVEIVQHLPI